MIRELLLTVAENAKARYQPYYTTALVYIDVLYCKTGSGWEEENE